MVCRIMAPRVAAPRINESPVRKLRRLAKNRLARITRSLMKTRPMIWKMTVRRINGRLQAQFPSQTDALSKESSPHHGQFAGAPKIAHRRALCFLFGPKAV